MFLNANACCLVHEISIRECKCVSLDRLKYPLCPWSVYLDVLSGLSLWTRFRYQTFAVSLLVLPLHCQLCISKKLDLRLEIDSYLVAK